MVFPFDYIFYKNTINKHFYVVSLIPTFAAGQNNLMDIKRIVITGGPGTGKTTIIETLMNLGFSSMEEVSRQIIRDAQDRGIDQLFLHDPLGFSLEVARGRARHFHDAARLKQKVTFFDRGIPDVPAYLNYSESLIPREIQKLALELRYDMVFLVHPWRDIYTADSERYESFEMAQNIHNHLVKTYQSLNYNPIEVPFGDVTSRVNFIISCLKKQNILPGQS